MKLSNKLLIAFGLTLILVPILGMVYSSQVFYTTRKEAAIEQKTAQSFSQKTVGMTSVPMPDPFHTINVVGAGGSYIVLHVITDSQSGVKIPEDFKKNIHLSVVNGILQFKLINLSKDSSPYLNVYVYAPAVNEVNVDQVNQLTLKTTSDSLNVNVKHAENLRFDAETKVNKLSVNATNVQSVIASSSLIESLSLNLSNSSFTSESTSYANLAIATAGACSVETNNSYRDTEEDQTIGNLTINTVGKAEVKLTNVKIATCTGSFSDETNVQMPAVNLNQMFKK